MTAVVAETTPQQPQRRRGPVDIFCSWLEKTAERVTPTIDTLRKPVNAWHRLQDDWRARPRAGTRILDLSLTAVTTWPLLHLPQGADPVPNPIDDIAAAPLGDVALTAIVVRAVLGVASLTRALKVRWIAHDRRDGPPRNSPPDEDGT